MKNWKLLAALAIMVIVMLAGFALAEGDFTVTDGVLTKYTGRDSTVVIPNDLGITEIGTSAFSYSWSITSVTVPEGVVTIGSNAFYSCNKLTEVALPDSLTGIGNSAFQNCGKLAEVSLPSGLTSIGSSAFSNCSSMTAINLPDSLTSIGNYAFRSCSKLTSLSFPANLQAIPDNLCQGCTSLEEVTLPNGLQSIGPSAFYGCSALNNVVLPEGLRSILASAFNDCDSLTQIDIPASVRTFGNDAFYSCDLLERATLADGPTSLAYELFGNCPVLSDVTLPDTLLSIPSSCFSHCSALEQISIPSSVTQIGQNAFADCTALTGIDLPDGLTAIATNTFEGCSALQEISIPAGVTTIDSSAFYDCAGLTRVQFNEGLKTIGSSAFHGCSALSALELPESLSNIRQNAFAGCVALREAVIPAGVQRVEQNAFNYCSSLRKLDFLGLDTQVPEQLFMRQFNRSIRVYCDIGSGADIACLTYGMRAVHHEEPGSDAFVIDRDGLLRRYTGTAEDVVVPDYVAAIGTYAFYDCPQVRSVTLPDTLLSIQPSAFYGCTGLTTITIPSNVHSLSEASFDNCASLESFQVAPDNAAYYSEDGVLFLRSDSGESACLVAYPKARAGATYTVPENVAYIGEAAFRGCAQLTSLRFSSTENLRIGPGAFYDCSGLTDFYYPGSLQQWQERVVVESGNGPLEAATSHFTSLGEGACGDDATYYVDNDGVMVISGTGEAVPINAGLPYRSVVIEEGITAIGDNMFANQTDLVSVSLPESLTSIGAGAFVYCSSLTSITLPAGVSQIGEWAFTNCGSLGAFAVDEDNESFSAVDGVLFSGDGTVLLAYPLGRQDRSYTIPDGVVEIATNAFRGNRVLETLALPASLARVCDDAFNDSYYLTTVSYPGTEDDWTNRVEIGANNYPLTGCQSMLFGDVPLLPVEGSCGTGATFVVDADGVLTISGTGEITLTNDDLATAVKRMVIEEGITGLSSSCPPFSIFTNMREATLPDSMTELRSGLFSGCAALETLRLPDSVTALPSGLCANCPRLRTVYLPEGLESIGMSAFIGCVSLETVDLPDSLEALDSAVFQGCTSLRSIALPGSITALASNMFSGCSSLETVGLPESLTSFASGVFQGCTSLKSIELPGNITDLGYGTFSGCTALESFTIPASVTAIRSAFLYQCTALTEITILTTQVSLDNGMFGGAPNVAWVTLADDVTSILAHTFPEADPIFICTPGSPAEAAVRAAGLRLLEGDAFVVENGVLTAYNSRETEVVIPEGVTAIGEGVFANRSDLRSVTFPEALTSIGDRAFEKCTGLRSAAFPVGLTSIGEGAFGRCAGLRSVSFPESLTSIGDNAFEMCTGLSEITLPAGLEQLAPTAFLGCTGVERFAVAAGSATFAAIDGVLFSADEKTVIAYPTARSGEYVVPDGVTTLGAYAFAYAGNLTRLNVPGTLEDIRKAATKECNGLKVVYFRDGWMTNEIIIFDDDNNENWWFYESLLEGNGYRRGRCGESAVFELEKNGTLTISGSGAITATAFGHENAAISNDMITNVIIGEGITAIDDSGVFAGMTSLIRLALPASLTSIGANAFNGCPELTAVELPEALTAIGENAFAGCEKLCDMDIPAGVTVVDVNAFSGCARLAGIVLEGADTVLTDADQTGLDAVVYCQKDSAADIAARAIDADIAYIGLDRFAVQDGVLTGVNGRFAEIDVPAGVVSIGEGAFASDGRLIHVSLPESVTAIGAGAFADCTALAGVTVLNPSLALDASMFTGCGAMQIFCYRGSPADAFAATDDRFQAVYLDDAFVIDASGVLTGYTGAGSHVVIPSGVTAIGENVFADCANLSSVTVPEGVEAIGDGAFANCTGLKDIRLPASLTQLGSRVFSGCVALKDISISAASESYTFLDGVLYSKDMTQLIAVLPGFTGFLSVPDGVEEILPYAADSCAGITLLDLPYGLYTIGEGAFSAMDADWIVIPNTLTSDPQIAFREDTQFSDLFAINDDDGINYLTAYRGMRSEVIIPDELNIDRINEYVFSFNPLITSVVVPESVTTIQNNAFAYCPNLETVTLPSTMDINTVSTACFSGSNVQRFVLSGEDDQLAVIDGAVYIRYDANSLCLWLFPTGRAGSYTLRGDTTEIFDNAFSGCLRLTGVTLPDGLISIGERAFSGCTSLESIRIPDSVISMGESIFDGCSNLRTVRLSTQLDRLPDNTFIECSQLEHVEGLETVKTISNSAFYNCASLREANLTGATVIYPYAFYGCAALESVTMSPIGERITIYANNFSTTHNLRELNILGTPDSWAACYIANNNDCLTALEPNYPELYASEYGWAATLDENGRLTISGRGNIPYRAFANDASITSLVIGNGITTIYQEAFRGCVNLTSVSLPATLKSIDCRAFADCVRLKQFTIPANLEDFGYNPYGFSDSQGLNNTSGPASVLMGSGVERIEADPSNRCFVSIDGVLYATSQYNGSGGGQIQCGIRGRAPFDTGRFVPLGEGSGTNGRDAVALLAIPPARSGAFTVPDGVQYIEGAAFALSKLTSLYIPDGIQIGEEAFCRSALRQVRLPGDLQELSSCAFMDCADLESIELPESLILIDDAAFLRCAKLKSVDLSHVIGLGESAFAECTGLETVDLSSLTLTEQDYSQWNNYAAFKNCTGLREVILDDGMERITSEMFSCCTGLQRIALGSAIRSVESGAFYRCISLQDACYDGSGTEWASVLVDPDNEPLLNALRFRIVGSGSCGDGTEYLLSDDGLLVITGTGEISDGFFEDCDEIQVVRIEEGVTGIGKRAFEGCVNLERVSIPASVSGIGIGAFNRCEKLQTVELAQDNAHLSVVNGVLYDAGMTMLHMCIVVPEGGAVEVPAGVQTVSDGAFAGKQALTAVSLPDSVRLLGSGAFYGCTALTAVDFAEGSTLTAVPDNAFMGCAALAQVDLPGSVESIGNDAFNGCAALDAIDLPQGLTSIGAGAFQRTGLAQIAIPSTVTALLPRTFKDCESLTGIALPNSLAAIYDDAFAGCAALATVTTPSGATTVDVYDLGGYRAVPGVRLPESLVYIGARAFLNCGSLETALRMPDGLRQIDNYAFFGCAGLKAVGLPDGMSEIGSYAFYGCSSLTGIRIPENINVLRTGTLALCRNLDTVVLSPSASSLDPYATSGSTNLSLVICTESATSNPDGPSVNSVGNAPYDSATIMTAIEFINHRGDNWYAAGDGTLCVVGTGEIGEGAFEAYDEGPLDSIYVLGDVTEIGERAFANNPDVSLLVLPGSLEYIAPSALDELPALYGYTVDGEGRYTVVNGILYCDDGATLVRFPMPRYDSFTVPEGVTTIGERAFADCLNIYSVTLPDGLTAIGREAFANCAWRQMPELTLPESVAEIGEGAFAGISGVNTLTLPAGITTIPASAFSGASLTEIAIPEGVTSIGDSAFNGCASLTEITVPEGVTSIGDSAFNGCASLTDIAIPEGVTSIGDSAFNGCASLTWLVLPESTVEIGDLAFDGIEGLNVYIPDSAVSIGATDGGYTVYCYESSAAERVLSDSCDIVLINAEVFEQLGGAMALNDESATLAPGETHVAGLTITPAFLGKVAVDWTSSSPEIASVDADGTITALANGRTTVTAAIGETTAQVAVHVLTRLTALDFEKAEYRLEANQTFTPALVKAPANASEELAWSVSDADALCAEVLPEGGVRLTAPGSVTLTVQSECGMVAQCELHVICPVKSIALDSEALKLTLGDSRVLGVTAVTTDDASYTDMLLHFESSDESVARADPTTGRIVTVARGRADIRVSNADGTVTALCHLRVKPVFVPMDEPDFTLPGALTTIEGEAFAGLPMQVVMCPETLQSIGEKAFAGCESLRQIYIPAGVESIQDDAFDGCPDDLAIYGYADSEAERIADLRNFAFMELEE